MRLAFFLAIQECLLIFVGALSLTLLPGSEDLPAVLSCLI